MLVVTGEHVPCRCTQESVYLGDKMKKRMAEKIVRTELHGHRNWMWFLHNKRGHMVSPWTMKTRSEAMKRLNKVRN